MAFWIKIVVSIGVLCLLSRTVSFEAVVNLLTRIRPVPLAAAAALIFVAQAPFAYRLAHVVRGLGAPISFRRALGLTFISHSLSQVLPSSYGGDVVKGAYLSGDMGLAAAVQATIVDRGAGLIVLFAKVALFLPFYAMFLPPAAHFAFGAATIAILAVGILIIASARDFALTKWRPVKAMLDIALAARRVFTGRSAGAVFAASVLIHVNGVLLYWLIAMALGAHVSFFACWLLVPMMYVIAMFPFALAGWGVREVGAVWIFGLAGIPADQAVAISVLFGLIMLLAATPGAILVSLTPFQAREPREPEGSSKP